MYIYECATRRSRRRSDGLGAPGLSAEGLRGGRVFAGMHYDTRAGSIRVDHKFETFLIRHCLPMSHACSDKMATQHTALMTTYNVRGVKALHAKIHGELR